MYYIYRITNKVNGKTYIGQHKYKDLNDKYMGSGKLIRRAQKKYGFENFKKEVLVFNISNKERADLLEKAFIIFEREKVGVENCYNITDGGQGGAFYKGYKHSEETRKKMSEAQKGKSKPMSEETMKKISETLKGHITSEETRRKLSEANKGKHRSEELRIKLSEVNKGKHLSDETKRKISEAKKGKIPWNKGVHHSEETRKKISETNKGRVSSRKGCKLTEETKRKISEAQKGNKSTSGMFWFTDGKRNVLAKECPNGFRRGRCQ